MPPPSSSPAKTPPITTHSSPNTNREYRPQSASESFHVETMIRADWHKRRLQNVEADLYHTVLAESPGGTLAAVLLSESPAAKLLARVQRQIAAFERTWHRANTELRRARAEKAESAAEGSLETTSTSFCPSRPRRIGFVTKERDPIARPTKKLRRKSGPPLTKRPANRSTLSAEARELCTPAKLEFTMAPPESGSVAVLAEKPSVARDIARVLGASSKGDGYLHGNGYVVTWAIGHLVALAQPHEINPEWRQWRRDRCRCCRSTGRWSSTRRPRTSSRS